MRIKSFHQTQDLPYCTLFRLPGPAVRTMKPADALCSNASEYPLNFTRGRIPEYVLNSYYSQINENDGCLFSDDSKTALSLWEYASDAKGRIGFPSCFSHGLMASIAFWHQPIYNHDSLLSFLALKPELARKDPKSMFL